MLDELTGVLESIQIKIQKYGDKISNEIWTRTVLIDPLLTVLGWDVTDPDQVTIEGVIDSGIPDYALLRSDGKIVAFVEAKKLGTSRQKLEDLALKQVTSYANDFGVDYPIISDGNFWIAYKYQSGVKLKDRVWLDVDISNTPVHESALELLALWNTNLSTDEPVKPNPPTLVGFPTKEPNSRSTKFEPGKDPSSSAISHEWVGLDELIVLTKSSSQMPVEMRFWDGATESLSNWIDILRKTIEKCFELGYLKKRHLPWGTPRKYFVTLDKKTKAGKPMKAARYLEKYGVYLESNLSKDGCCARTKQVMKLLDLNSPIQFRF